MVHVASPLATKVKHEREIIDPAVNGTRAVLEACEKYKIERLIITSSGLAVMDPYKLGEKTSFNESDFLEPRKQTPAYDKSKVMAEKLAWDFHSKLPKESRFDLIVLCPGLIVGPFLVKAPNETASLVTKLMTGKLPGCPRVMVPWVDVRDVAVAHLKAVDSKPNERYVIV